MVLSELLVRLREERAGVEKKCKVCSTAGVEGWDALRAEYYRRVIERYSSVISFGEEKSIPELKRIVSPDECVRRKANELAVGEDFAVAAFDYVASLPLLRSKISVSVWLSPSEVMELGCGDVMDKAVLLCSLLLAMGLKASLRVVELEEGLKHPVVVVRGETCALLDPSGGANATGKSPEELLAGFSFQDKRFVRSLYEFDDSAYEAFQ
ncbi:MAG: hypothetical protein WC607_00445 [Candidatus Micrarchaeia archaeon]